MSHPSDQHHRIAGVSSLRIEAYRDRLVETHGHDPRSAYASQTGGGRIFECPECCSVAGPEAVR